MANENKDGGPAFPYAFQHEDDQRFIKEGFASGMTLRDYFAAKALTGNLAADAEQKSSARQHADWAFEQADAMLAARSGERK